MVLLAAWWDCSQRCDGGGVSKSKSASEKEAIIVLAKWHSADNSSYAKYKIKDNSQNGDGEIWQWGAKVV